MTATPPPRTSVIIPARNAGDTLAETLASLLAQTVADWEAIIVDDASTDATSSIIDAHCRRDGRFFGVDGRGEGASSARNIGLSQARGKWLLFLDSDDWIGPTFLAAMLQALEAAPDAIAAYCAYQRVTPTGDFLPARWTDQISHSAFDVFARHCGVAIHSVLVDRRVVMELSGFDTSLRTCEEWDLWQRVARTGGRFIAIEQSLAFYRMSEGSLTHDVAQMVADARIVIDRGFAPDPRVAAPAPCHAAGASASSGGSAGMAFAYFCLWCAAFEVGRGRDGRPILASNETFPDSTESCATMAEVILDALPIGGRCLLGELALRWRSFRHHLVSLVKQCAAGSPLPGFARLLQYRLERQLSSHLDLSVPVIFELMMAVRMNVRKLETVRPPPGIELLYVRICEEGQIIAILILPVFGIVSARHVAALLIERMGLSMFYDKALLSHKPSFWWHAARQMAKQAIRQLAGLAPRAAPRTILREAGLRAAVYSAGPAMAEQTSDLALAELVDRTRAEVDRAGRQASASPPLQQYAAKQAYHGDRSRYWDALFETPDPWDYGSDYEQIKYRRQLSLVPPGRVSRGLEVGCAEGWFTEQLAGRVDQLIATDISRKALDRARRRCASRSNVRFEHLDISVDETQNNLDLIVCSEILYYLKDRDELNNVCRKLSDALAQDGRLLCAHAFILKDNLDRTAFDWDHSFGAEAIARAFENTPGLALERSLQTELYRIDLYRRRHGARPQPDPVVEILSVGAELESKVARHILWGGATARRADLIATETVRRVPVLMYHRIAEGGPTELARYRTSPGQFLEQMRWLRRNGYHAISSQDLTSHLTSATPFAGRPVLITFDDGTKDFQDAAWPILRDHDLTAEVFVVTDFVGQFAQWDRCYGAPAKLMSRDEIVTLRDEGAHFGSHLASHTAVDRLSNRDLAVELARSRANLEAWLGQPVHSFASPFGSFDERLFWLAHFCGYRIGFTTANGVTTLGDDPLRLPRIEVRGEWQLEQFIQALEQSR